MRSSCAAPQWWRPHDSASVLSAPSRRPCRSGTAGIRSARSTSARGATSFSRIAPGSFRSGLSTQAVQPPGAGCRRASSAPPGAGRSRSACRGPRPIARRAGLAAPTLDALAVGRVEHQRAGRPCGSAAAGARSASPPLKLMASRDAGALARCGARNRPSGTTRRWRRSAPRSRGCAPAAGCFQRLPARHRSAGTAPAARTRSGAAARARCRRRSAPPRSRWCPSRSRGRAARRPLRRAAPAGGGEHRRGQRFLQRRVALVLPPAALEQRLARGVDVQRGALAGRGAARAAGRAARVSTLGPLAGRARAAGRTRRP